MRQAPCSGRRTPESADCGDRPAAGLAGDGAVRAAGALMPGLPAQSVIHFAIGRRKVTITDRN